MNRTEIENKIFLMDCLDFMKQLPDDCVDVSFTSPPMDLWGVPLLKSRNLKDVKILIM